MHILPFDPLAPRSLSIVLLVLIVLVTQADNGIGKSSSLVTVSQTNRGFACPVGTPATAGCGRASSFHISGGNLTTTGRF